MNKKLLLRHCPPLGKLLALCFLFPISIMANDSNNMAFNPETTTNEVQQKAETITGVVKDQNGDPLIGVTVSVKGTTVGIMTDVEGKFTLKASMGSTLLFNYLGYKNQEVKVKGEAALDITLDEDSKILDEVVIVGFGTQKKINLTGSVASIDSETFKSRPISNTSEALQGVIPGLNLSVANSELGGGSLRSEMSIDIRGTGVIGESSKSSPLVLIDGLEGNMNTVNPNDIENISVLKDAASAAIYGSRAAFGVILITTKNGKAGKTTINYNNSFRFNKLGNVPEMVDSYTFAQYVNTGMRNSGKSEMFTSDVIERIQQFQKGELTDPMAVTANGLGWLTWAKEHANTDWFDVFYKDWSNSMEHNVSVNGGNEKYTYYLSAGFLDSSGMLRYGNETRDRYNVNAKIGAKITKHVNINYNMKWYRNIYGKASYLSNTFFQELAKRFPNMSPFDNNGHPSQTGTLLQLRDGGRTKMRDNTINNQLQIVINPTKNWNIYLDGNMKTAHAGTTYNVLPVYAKSPKGEDIAVTWGGSYGSGVSYLNETAGQDDLYGINAYTDYVINTNNGHSLKGMVGFNSELFESRYLSGSRKGLVSPDVIALDAAFDEMQNTGKYDHWSTAGFFGRLNYNFKERYLFEANLRYDGTSRFVGDKRWATLPSFSLGWNIAREDFFKSINQQISSLKLRASWGELGNTNTSNYYPTYQTMTVKAQDGTWLVDQTVKPNTAKIPALVSSMLTWEKVSSTNFGLDWSMLNNRLSGSFDYFIRDTKDMVGPAPELPVILGIAVPNINNADLRSKGYEIQLSWRDRIQEFQYGISLSMYDAKQTVTKYPNETKTLSTSTTTTWFEGQTLGDIWGYETVGIAKTQEEMDAHLASLPNGGQTLGSRWEAGDIMYKDLNNDGRISTGANTLADPGDRKVLGNSTPRYSFGITLDGEWKGFDFRCFFQGIGKRDMFLSGPYFWGAYNNEWNSTVFKQHLNYFRSEGDPMGANLDSYYPRPQYMKDGKYKNQQTQSKYMQNAAYIRLKNAQIGYTLPKNIVNAIKLSYARIFVSGENLWTYSKLAKMFDPELLKNSKLGNEEGDGKLYPLSKTFSVGVNINF